MTRRTCCIQAHRHTNQGQCTLTGNHDTTHVLHTSPQAHQPRAVHARRHKDTPKLNFVLGLVFDCQLPGLGRCLRGLRVCGCGYLFCFVLFCFVLFFTRCGVGSGWRTRHWHVVNAMQPCLRMGEWANGLPPTERMRQVQPSIPIFQFFLNLILEHTAMATQCSPAPAP